MKNYSVKILFVIVVLAQISIYAQPGAFETAYDKRQWFDLRDRVLQLGAKDESTEMLFYRGVVANRFNDLKESTALLQKYVKRAEKSAAHLPDAYEILADNYTKTYGYGKAAATYKFLIDNYQEKLEAERIKGFENVFGLWNALRDVPRQTVSFGDSTIQGTRDKANLLNLSIEVGNQKMDFIFDTGANISTISLSTAEKLGLKIIESDVSVGSSTDKKVKSKLAVAPAMKIGNAVVRNVVFLVMDDKALFFPQINYQINGIVGFPVIEAFGAVSISRDNQIRIFEKKTKDKVEPNMCLQGLLPLVAGTYKNERMIFSFDTGAVTSEFHQAFFLKNEAEIKKNSAEQKIKVGGAGGYMEVPAYGMKDLELTVGGKTARFAKTRVLSQPTNEDSRYFYGNLGQDLIKQFERMTLDFQAMRLSFK